ncbi:hypothetical protein KDL01_15015 [Actinospica durhamensis]|uniref:Uncharacterized protein n=1 Tax=Actinospica durhamensis TaxID=1508375 RepID=A0A941IS60_9ACTN|nr:hypothetical protein [Actinospica durhamensis]MBR7834583.1 hypothetical protein [Actinospica durhamensis]
MSENENENQSGIATEVVATETVTEVVADAGAEVVTEDVATETVTEVAFEAPSEFAADVSANPAEPGDPTAFAAGIPTGIPDGVPTEIPAEPKTRRRIKSRSLFVGALVLGVLGGAGTGYAVQSSRPPTPLPSLIAQHPAYAPVGVYAGVAPSPLPSSQDDLTLTDGDLTKLLMPTPSGASVGDSWDHEWIGLVDDAALCDDQKYCFTQDLIDGISALADTGWTTKSGYYEEIRILRFAPQYQTGSFLQGVSADGSPVTTPADLNATGVEYKDAYDANTDYAVATHGDLVVEFWVSSYTRTPNPSLINALMTQQMARL